MPLLHKYQQHNFGNGFETHNSILDVAPYPAEVIFIGTYNHGWQWNLSDFFYGRGMYMWTVLGNLFLHKHNHFTRQRTANNNQPTFPELFEICGAGKIVFADIVKGIKTNINAVENIQQRCVLVNDEYEWCARVIKGRNVGEYSDIHLDNMGHNDWLDDNVEAIIKFINETSSIKHIYFTFKSGRWLVDKLNDICRGVRVGVSYSSVFTPTASGFGALLPPPYNQRAWGIAHCWVWNGLNHAIPINRLNYGHLDHGWLLDKGVNPNAF